MPIAVYVQVLCATLLWGTAFPVAKIYLRFVGPLTLAGVRFSLAGFLLLAVSVFIEKRGDATNRAGPVHWGKVLLIGLLSTFTFYGVFFIGFNMTSASSAAAVDATGPVISAVMAHFILHQDRLNGRKILSLLLAFSGIITIALFRPKTGGAGHVSPLGCFLVMCGLTFGSAGTMQVVKYRGSLSLVRLIGCQMVFGAILLLLTAHFVEGPIRWHQPGIGAFVAGWVWLSCVSATAFTLWYHIVRQYKITSLSTYSFLTGIWGMTLSILFLHDPLTSGFVAGACLVIAAAVIMATAGENPRRAIPVVE